MLTALYRLFAMNTFLPSFSKRFAHQRILWSRLILVVTLFIAIFSGPPAYLSSLVLDVFELTGYVMLCSATLWRVWCLVFIGGTKDGLLSQIGPYSVVRNPLYLGNFFGVVGFGLALGLPLLALSLAITFGVLYPSVVEQEEARLHDIFGESFARYCSAVPRWFPRWSLYREPATLLVSPARVRQGILDSMWYLWAFAFIETLEVIHEHSLLLLLF
jgi:protein-S-isoprenylcysteine O-methyltransferase Ste14